MGGGSTWYSQWPFTAGGVALLFPLPSLQTILLLDLETADSAPWPSDILLGQGGNRCFLATGYAPYNAVVSRHLRLRQPRRALYLYAISIAEGLRETDAILVLHASDSMRFSRGRLKADVANLHGRRHTLLSQAVLGSVALQLLLHARHTVGADTMARPRAIRAHSARRHGRIPLPAQTLATPGTCDEEIALARLLT